MLRGCGEGQRLAGYSSARFNAGRSSSLAAKLLAKREVISEVFANRPARGHPTGVTREEHAAHAEAPTLAVTDIVVLVPAL
jgi:hypothetical protein